MIQPDFVDDGTVLVVRETSIPVAACERREAVISYGSRFPVSIIRRVQRHFPVGDVARSYRWTVYLNRVVASGAEQRPSADKGKPHGANPSLPVGGELRNPQSIPSPDRVVRTVLSDAKQILACAPSRSCA